MQDLAIVLSLLASIGSPFHILMRKKTTEMLKGVYPWHFRFQEKNLPYYCTAMRKSANRAGKFTKSN